MAHQRHLVHAGLRPAGFDLGQALGLLLGGEFQRLQILEGAVEVDLGGGMLALDLLQRVAQIFAPRVDGAQEGRKGQTADVGIAGALFFAGDIVVQIGKLAFQIGAHGVDRGDAPLHLVDAETLQTQQSVGPVHHALPFPAPPRMSDSAA